MTTAVLLSGGVDSSVALSQLVEAGERDLTAFYLKIWLEDELSYLGDCPWEEDLRFARSVCARFGVPLEVVPLQQDYYARVVSYAVQELRRGHTPSPDIFCNQRVKFGAFVESIGSSFDTIATGHYGRIVARDGLFYLLKGIDPVKDQTYFLSHLSQEQLARAMFPIGHLEKSRVRELAARYELTTAERDDSQGICFLGKIKFNDFVRFHLGERTGAIVERSSGRKLGEHRGYWFHTIGQRKGLGLSQGPWYVVDKDVGDNVVYVSHADDLRSAQRDRFRVVDAHWITAPPQTHRLTTKLRHSPQVVGCRIFGLDACGFAVELDEPDAGVTPGQFSIFYDGEICLGGARIV